jgi:cbb3-type cytochrome oxidase subunit 1
LRKNAYAGMEYMPHRFVVGALIALTLAWAPWVSLGLGLLARNGPALMIGLWGLLAQVLATAPILVFLRLPFPFAFTLPCGISAYVAIATSSVWHYHRGRILWKDRAISSKVTAPRTNAATREN